MEPPSWKSLFHPRVLVPKFGMCWIQTVAPRVGPCEIGRRAHVQSTVLLTFRARRKIMIKLSGRTAVFATVLVAYLFTPAKPAKAQSPDNSVMPLIKVSGALADRTGKPRVGTVGMTFALYQESEGGNPLWMET